MKSKMFLMLLMALGLAFAGLSVDGYTVSKSVFAPNEPGVVTITVTNPSGAERVSSITMSIDNPPEIQVTSAPQMADIDAGGTAIVSIPFRVAADARPGIYLLNVQFSGFVSGGAPGFSQTSVNTVSVPVMVVNEPDLSISTDSSLLTGIDEVSLTISNNGGPAKNVQLATTGDVSLYGTDSIWVGDLSGNQSFNVTLDSRSAADGPADVVFRIDYEDELGMKESANASLRLTVRNEKLDLNFIQQSEIITKNESTLSLMVGNAGTNALRDVRLSFTDPNMRLKDSNELRFGDIAPGANATASALVVANMPPGVNLVNATVSWIEKDIQKEESIMVPLTITSDADVGVYLEAKPLPLTLGGDYTISVLVSNLGSYSIDNVDVSISSPAMRSLDISDRQYIGGLQSDDFSTVQFSMEMNATSEGTYPVYVTINYRDQSGEMVQKVVSQEVSVYSPVQVESSPIPIIAGLIVLAVLVWYFWLRKKAPAK